MDRSIRHAERSTQGVGDGMLMPPPLVMLLAANLGRVATLRVTRTEVGSGDQEISTLVKGRGRQNFADAQIDIFKHVRFLPERLRRFSRFAANRVRVATMRVARAHVRTPQKCTAQNRKAMARWFAHFFHSFALGLRTARKELA